MFSGQLIHSQCSNGFSFHYDCGMRSYYSGKRGERLREKVFENKIKDYLKEKGAWFVKTWSNGVQRDGIPDIIACVNGYFVGIEVKAATGHPSALQLHNIKWIRESNGIGIILYPDQFEEFKTFIEGLFFNKPLNRSAYQHDFDSRLTEKGRSILNGT